LASSYQELSNAFTEATELKSKVLDGAQDVFDASAEGYREGKLDYLNVLDAQRTLFEAKERYIEALSAYHKARADVERLIGQRIDTIETIQQQ
jgi:cobalt-zinc-cadmium efflux system outer membrane protein